MRGQVLMLRRTFLTLLVLTGLAAPASALASTEITVGVVGHGTVSVGNPQGRTAVPDCTAPASNPGGTSSNTAAGTEVDCAAFVGANYDSCFLGVTCASATLSVPVGDFSGWHFDHWSGSCTGTFRQCTIHTRNPTNCVNESQGLPFCLGPFTAVAHFVDTRTPTTSFTTAPANNSVVYSDSQSQQFGFHTDEDAEGPSFQCRQETSGTFGSCASPFTWNSIPDGLHDFCARGTDASGLTGANACVHWEQERNPTAAILTQPPATSTTSDAAFTYNSNKTAHPADGSSLTYLCKLDLASFSPCGAAGQSYTLLQNGQHTFQVEAVFHGVLEGGGVTHTSAPATYTWTQADTQGPTVALTSSPDGTARIDGGRSATISWTGDQPTQQQTFECKLDADPSDFQPCTSPVTLTNLADGIHDFRIRGKNFLNDTGPTKLVHWDQEVPADAALSAGPAAGSALATRNTSFSFTATKPGTTFECKLDAGSFASCTSPHALTVPTDGSHTFSVRGKFHSTLDGLDHAGAAVSRTWTVDTVPPDTTITGGPSAGLLTSDQHPTLTFSSTEGGSFRCSLDGAAFALCASPHAVNAGIGPHTFRVEAVDAVGNVDPTPAARSWKVVADADGDGYPAGIDCNDSNPAVHPGAIDIPGDGIDQDCKGGDAPFPALGATVSATWNFHPSYTSSSTLLVLHVPAGTKIVVTCKGKKHSCTFKKKTIKVKHATSKVSLAKYFKRAKLLKGTKIDIRITKPATVGYETTFTTRNGKAPKQRTRSLEPA